MNRIAGRSLVVLVLVCIMVLLTGFFIFEYATQSSNWVISQVSPHLYQQEELQKGMVVDANGILLLDMEKDIFCTDPAIRQAMVHWVGDRQGNVATPVLKHYDSALVPYDPVNGVYTYGDAQAVLHLTMDARIQAAALEAMGDHRGTVAVYNYKTGQILCAVSTPGFDPESPPDQVDDSTALYVNRFLRMTYIPGSIFKIFTLAVALETLPDVQQQTFTCTGSWDTGGRALTCLVPHGTMTLKEAFAKSCNCVFGQLALQIGRENMLLYAEKCGLNQALVIDGAETLSRSYIASGENDAFAWSGVGQDKDEIVPAIFLNFVGAIANGGQGVSMHAVAGITVNSDVLYKAEPQILEPILKPETAAVIKEYMANNVQMVYGSQDFPGLQVCAKSGTAEKEGHRPNAMFAGFVADESCPLAFIVCIEDGGFGADTCSPVISHILKAVQQNP